MGTVAGGHRTHLLPKRQSRPSRLPPVDDRVAVVAFYRNNRVTRHDPARKRIEDYHRRDFRYIEQSEGRRHGEGSGGKETEPRALAEGM